MSGAQVADGGQHSERHETWRLLFGRTLARTCQLWKKFKRRDLFHLDTRIFLELPTTPALRSAAGLSQPCLYCLCE